MQVITVVGSGGKTTAIREYAVRCREAGKKVLIVTTTHMLAEGEELCLTGSISDIREMLEKKGCCMAGLLADKRGEKFGPLPPAVYQEACLLADVVLVEGDGSRGLPAKFPAAWEPVIPENTTQLLVVAGMRALGDTIGRACHRPEEALRCLNSRHDMDDNTVITLPLLKELLTEGYLKPLRGRFPALPIRILAGQKDTLYRKAAGALLEQQAPAELLEKLKPEWFADRPHLVLCGAGHVAAALYRIALLLEYRITVLDDREEFADPARFPEAEKVCRVDFARIGDFLPREPGCCYAVLTRGHRWDEECVEAVLKSPAGFAYLGMIGSREKVAGTLASLRRKGFSEEQLARLFAPIGLDLGGRRPSEIAVSIAAQLICCQSGREGRVSGGIGSGAGKRTAQTVWLSKDLQELGKRRELCGVLAVITGKTGSAPGEEGSLLFLQPDGTLTGTVGGGSLEYQAVQEMKALWKAVCSPSAVAVRPLLKTYDISPSSAAALDMRCGGRLEILFITIVNK